MSKKKPEDQEPRDDEQKLTREELDKIAGGLNPRAPKRPPIRPLSNVGIG